MITLLLIVVMMGMLVPVQTAANARLRIVVGPALVATLLSFSVSTVGLLAVSLAMGLPLVPGSDVVQAAPWWSWTGGIIALFTITVNILLFKTLGQLQTTVLPMLGQLAFSLVIDHFGLFGVARIPLTPLRLLAMGILMVGVVLTVVVPNLGNWRRSEDGNPWHTAFWQVTGVAAGCLMASIGAIYGRLGLVLGSAIQASTVSFVIATSLMLAICVVSGRAGCARQAFRRHHPWWMWAGGVVGALVVVGNSWLIPLIGAGAFFMFMLFGQMLLSLCMERFGWFGAIRNKISAVQLVGILLMFVGVALIK